MKAPALKRLLAALLVSAASALAAEPAPTPAEHEHGATPMAGGMDEQATDRGAPSPGQPMTMDMGGMQGGRAPADARDPDAWADGYEYTGMAGFEKTDQLAFGMFLLDEFEFVSGSEGKGGAWSFQAARGGDTNKLWLRSQGLKIGGQPVDPETGAEALWWRALTPFWGTVLGMRQDFGAASHSWLAFGVEGLAPYWFELEATAYVGEDGRLAARFKASYDLLFTNRLILTPGIESNAYSRSEPDRGLGDGVSNVEFGLRLRYEVHRKFAPYIGYVWDRSFAGTADLARQEGDDRSEHRLVAGLRLWW